MKRKVLPCFMALSMTLTAVPNVAMAEDGSMNEAGAVVETTTETGATTGTEPAEEPARGVGTSEVVDRAEGTSVNNGVTEETTEETVVEATKIQPAMAMATGEVAAKNGVVEVATVEALKEAVATAADSGVETTIQLTENIEDLKTEDIIVIPADAKIILDMNGKTISTASDFNGRPIVNNGTLTVKGNGTIDSSNANSKKNGTIGMGAIDNFGTLLIENGTYKGSVFGGAAIRNKEGASLTIEDGYFESNSAVYNFEGATAVINGGEFHSEACNAIKDDVGNGSYYAYAFISAGDLYFNDGKVTGVQGALAINNGYAEVKNGTFETVTCEHGNNTAFYALYIAGERGVVDATISGGTFKSATRVAVSVGNDNTGGDGGLNLPANATITGGTFIGGGSGAAALEAPKTGTLNIISGTFSSDVGEFVDPSSDIEKDESGNWVTKPIPVEDAVASVGDKNYKSLAEAVEAVVTSADKTGTVLLRDNATGSGIGLFNGKGHTGVNLTIDFGGYTYTCEDPAVGSSGTESQGFHLEKGNTVVLKNGKIAVADSSQKTIMLIQNYCDLTLEDLTLEGGAKTQYIVSSNYGDVVLNRVNISGTYSDLSNLVALDVMHWHGDSGYEDKAPTLEVHNTSANMIQGKMNVYCYGTGSEGCQKEAELTLYGGSYIADPRAYLAPGYVVKENGGKFIVSEKSSGGGSHRYDGYITIINPKNGTVSVSDDWADEDQKITLTITPDKGYVVDKIEIVDLEGDKIDAKKVEDEDNEYTFRMANCDVTVTVTFKEEGKTEDKEETNETEETDKTEETTTPETVAFSDVSESDWFYKGVSYVVENGMMNGVGENQFAPNAPLTREMLAVVLYNMEKQPESTGVNPFADVKADMWYTDAIVWANANGIVAGYDDSTFGLGDSITREQLAAILYRYAQMKGYDVTEKADLTGYADSAAISGYAVEAMQWANANGIVNGMTATTLAPQGTATRAQVATMLMNFCENVVTKAE